MPLTNPFRRSATSPTLRERAASLRASLAPAASQPAPLPAPGSEEAMAAFHAACHEHTIRTEFANEYPELKRSTAGWWTADTLARAMETGEITPAECARLYPRATERELRMAEIEHELKLGALHALAFANDYPVPSATDEGDEADADLLALAPVWQKAVALYSKRMEELGDVESASAARDVVRGAEKAVRTAGDALHAIEVQIGGMPALTMAGVRLKARIAQRSDSFEIVWPDGFGEGLVRDILALGEPEAKGDVDLIRLGLLFEAARGRAEVANEACNAAGREADGLTPKRPDALTLRTSDHSLRVYQMLTYPTMLDGLQLTARDIEWLRGRMPMTHEVLRPIQPGERAHIDHPGRRFDVVPHPEAQARAEEIITAWDSWQAERMRIYGEHLTQELEDAADAACTAVEALAERIAECSAHTAAGLLVKLRALNHFRRNTLLAEIPRDPDPDQLLAHSLWCDMQDEPVVGAADTVDWNAPPPGFMAYPERKPKGFIAIRRGLRRELERLLIIAQSEFARRVDGKTSAEMVDRIRRELRLSPLAAAVRGEPTHATDLLDRDLSREAFDYAYGLNLTAVPFRNLVRLYEVFNRTADLLNDAAQEDQFWAQANSGIHTVGGTVIDAEQNRLACIRDICAMELAKRAPASEADRDAALVIRLRHEMLCETKIRDKALLAEIREAWAAD